MRSQAFFTNSPKDNTTPPVDLLDFPLARNDRVTYPTSLGSVEFNLGPFSPTDTSML